MGFDNVCDTRLALGLSLTSSPSMVKLTTMGSTKQPCASLDHLHKTVTKPMHCFEPSLTLSLSASNHRDPDPNKKHVVRDRGVVFPHNSSVISGGCSSFSNMSVKREREVGSEESERVSNGNNYSRVMSATSVDEVEDDDVCHVNGRKKLRLTKPQSDLLEEAFKLHSSLSPKQKQELARKLKLRPRQVEVWFQNRRARSKLKQTEMEFEHLKKICDKLTCENQKIQKEIQELKAFKSSEPFYMQLSTASLTLCPSCERIGDTKSSIAKNPFTMAANPQFLNSFTNPSAAC